jgi:hypothetical protein
MCPDRAQHRLFGEGLARDLTQTRYRDRIDNAYLQRISSNDAAELQAVLDPAPKKAFAHAHAKA